MIYFDNAATTKIRPEVLDAMMPYLTTEYGNPSALYSLGQNAKDAIERARELIAVSINAEPEEIYFTSGATEGINWINKEYKWNGVVTINTEHHATLNSLNSVDSVVLPVISDGFFDYESIPEWANLFMCSHINNEIGTIQPIDRIGQYCWDNEIYFFVDATASYGKLNIDVKKDHIDYLVASGHKFHAPKGIGFIYINSKASVRPLFLGGRQENNNRAGTENVAGIVGMAKASEIAYKNIDENTKKVSKLRDCFFDLMRDVDYAELNGTKMLDYRYCGNLNYRFNGIRGEQLASFLNDYDIYVSTGSACASDSNEPSHVLKAIGLSDEEAESSIRFTFNEENTEEEVMKVVNTVKRGVELLR